MGLRDLYIILAIAAVGSAGAIWVTQRDTHRHLVTMRGIELGMRKDDVLRKLGEPKLPVDNLSRANIWFYEDETIVYSGVPVREMSGKQIEIDGRLVVREGDPISKLASLPLKYLSSTGRAQRYSIDGHTVIVISEKDRVVGINISK